MESKAPIRLVVYGTIIAIAYGIMFGAASFFNTTKDCPYTLLVGQGGLAKADCVDFNSFKYNDGNNHLSSISTSPEENKITKEDKLKPEHNPQCQPPRLGQSKERVSSNYFTTTF